MLLNLAGYASMAAMYARWLLREARLSGPEARDEPEMLQAGPQLRVCAARGRGPRPVELELA